MKESNDGDKNATQYAATKIAQVKAMATPNTADKYYAIFNSIDEGFCIYELIYDEEGKPVDLLWVEVNPAYEIQTGLQNVIGKRHSDLGLGTESYWLETFDKVIRTGQSVQLENWHKHTQRWYNTYTSRIGKADTHQVAVLFSDITERKLYERQQEFLLKISDGMRLLSNPLEIAQTACRMLADELEVTRIQYTINEGQPGEEIGEVWGEYVRKGSPMPRRYHLAPFGEANVTHLRSGKTLIINDINHEPNLTNEQKAMFLSVESPAAISVPLIKNNRFAATLTVHDAHPREWTNREIILVEEIAERTWAGVERALAEHELRESERKYRTLFETMSQGYQENEVIRDENGLAIDHRLLNSNPQFERLTGLRLEDCIGKPVKTILPQIEDFWLKLFDRVARSGIAERCEHEVASMRHWYDVYAFSIEGDRVGVLFEDITERKQAEQRQAFLLKLNDALRPLNDAADIRYTAAMVLGEQLGANRVAYAENLPEDDSFIVFRNYVCDAPDMAGCYRYEDYGSDLFNELSSGTNRVQPDIASDQRLTEHEKNLFKIAGIGASMNIPLIKGGQLVAFIGINYNSAHNFTKWEIKLVEEVTDRTWAAVERARAEETSRESEKRFQSIANLVPDLLWDSEPDGSTNWYNARWLEYTGQLFEDAIGWGRVNAIHPDDRAGSAKRYAEAVENGKPLQQEHRVRRFDGEYRWFMVNASPVKDTQGRVIKMYGAATDIHDRKQVEEALHKSELEYRARLENEVLDRTTELYQNRALLQATLDSNVEMIQVFEAVRDNNNKIIDFIWILNNQTSEKFYGDVIGKSLLENNPGVRDMGIFDTFIEATETGVASEHERHYIHEQFDGWFYQSVVKLNDGVATNTVNITDRKKAELKLKESLERLQSILNTTLVQMSILVAIRDEQGNITDLEIKAVNQELEKETGRNDLVGKHYAQEYPGIRQAGLFDLIVKTIETGKPHGTEYFYQHDGFGKWFSCMFVKLDDGVVATNMDITANKQAEEERFKNYVLLQHSEDLAALGSWDYNLHTKSFSWSDGMYLLFELAKGKEINPEIYLEYATDNGHTAAERVVQHIRAGDADFEETLELNISGRFKIIHLKAAVVRNSEGKAEKVLGVNLDISAIRAAEERIRKLEAEQQVEIFKATLRTQEEERRRISESLHNGLGQMLYGIKMSLAQLNVKQAIQNEAEYNEARRYTSDLLSEAIRDTRRISHELMPTVLNEFGLDAAIKDVCNQMQDRTKFNCIIKLKGVKLDKYMQLAVFRTLQELMTNIVKHADATEAKVEVCVDDRNIFLRVSDNGKGIDADKQGKDGIGLASIKSKVDLLNGTVNITSVQSHGTDVKITLPYKPQIVN